jgi:hypothetical protein
MGWARQVIRMRTEMHTELWWGKPEGRRPTGRPRRRCEDNIKIDVIDDDVDRICLAENRCCW